MMVLIPRRIAAGRLVKRTIIIGETVREEARIKLDKWFPRDYQLPLLEAIEKDGFKKALVVMPRRAR
jgi:hypothetical protein